MIKISALIKTILVPGRQVRLGLSRAGSGVVHALVSHSRKGHNEIISAGPGIPALARLLVPAIASGDLDNTPVYLKAAPLGQQEPEVWVDRNESEIIPQGATPESIINEFAVHEGTIYSATVSKTALLKAAQCPDENISYAFLSAPIWNLGRLYGQSITTPFILWRLAKDGSVFGLVRNGRCEKIAHSWIGADDVVPDNREDISGAITLLCDGELISTVHLVSPEKNFTMPGGFSIPGFELEKLPPVAGLSDYCHEAYANASFGPESDHNFIPFDKFQKGRTLERQAGTLMAAVRLGLWLLIGSIALFSGLDLGMNLIDKRYRGPMEVLRSQEVIVRAAEKRHETLMKQVAGKAKFATERSRVTNLLADLQTIFPEDAWAENITIANLDKNKFQCDIQAFAYSSGKVSMVLDSIRTIKGLSNARLVYSEQTLLPDKSKAIRFKITGEWK